MNKSSNFFLYTGLLLILLSGAQSASADTTLTPGEVQLSVAGILLDVEGSSGTLDQVSFNGNSFDIILNSGQTVTFSSTDRRQLSYSPSSASSYITRTCTSVKSSLAINGSGLSSPLTITITPESSTCSSGDGGGGIVTGNNIGYNFGPTPVIISAPVLPLTTPTIKVIPSQLPPSELQPPITTLPYEPGAPILIPPQTEIPQPELPSAPSPVTAPVTVVDFFLLYWPWIIAVLAAITVTGILLFITLRE